MVQALPDLVKIAGQTIARTTLKGLQLASAKSGVDFQYLVAKAAQESSFKTDAEAGTSSATGLFQFTRGTWLDMVKKHGERYGFGAMAKQIDDNGAVKSQTAEKRILALREDPEASALMAAEYARANATQLEQAVGREADAPDLYLAHFMGPRGAIELLKAAEETPHVSAASLVPAAAKANTSVFYSTDGKARSAADVVALIRDRFSGQMDRYADVANALGTESPARAMANTAPKVRGNAFKQFDMADAMASGNAERMTASWFVLEELAKLMSMRPMTMTNEEDEENSEETALSTLSPGGFQGSDWAAALSNRAAAQGESAQRAASVVTAGHGAKAYGALQTAAATPGDEQV